MKRTLKFKQILSLAGLIFICEFSVFLILWFFKLYISPLMDQIMNGILTFVITGAYLPYLFKKNESLKNK